MIVGGGLLCTVADGMAAGVGDNLRVGSEEMDFRDVGTFLWKRKEFCIELEKIRCFLVVPLAKEIGFANGSVGKRKLNGGSTG